MKCYYCGKKITKHKFVHNGKLIHPYCLDNYIKILKLKQKVRLLKKEL